MKNYKGKYPRRIQIVSSAGRGETVFQLNDGSVFRIPNRDLKRIGYDSAPPKPGEDFDSVLHAIELSAPERRSNPIPRKGISKKRYVSRPSQATGRKPPSKRLKARRTKALSAPKKGYFPNPAKRSKPYIIVAEHPTKGTIFYDGVGFSLIRENAVELRNKKAAVAWGHLVADKFNLPVKVMVD